MKYINIIKRAARFIIKGVPIQQIHPVVKVYINEKSLAGKNIVITGGGAGIGYAIAKKCIAEGANVLITGRNQQKLINAQNELGGEEKCKYKAFDISNVEQIQQFLCSCYDFFNGSIHCLVNNAGISFHEKTYKEVTIDGFKQQFETNYVGTYFLSKFFLEEQEKRNALNKTNLLFVSSERGSFNTDIPYGLTKAIINSLVGGLNNRIAQNGARVNAIAPGVTASEMTGRKLTDDFTYTGSPCGRTLMPEEIAEVAAFLISDQSYCISGEVINCDNGAHLKCY